MRVLLGVILVALLVVVVGAALIAFPWSPSRSAAEGTGLESGPSGARDAQTSPAPSGRRTSASESGRYRGTGSRNLGTIEVGVPSVLRWTTAGENGIRSFAVMDDDFRINVSVQGEPSGQSRVKPGAYRNVTVNAVGNWTMSIEPG